MKSKQKLKNTLEESIKIKKRLLKLDKQIDLAINQIYKSIKLGGKILLCGNGGSAADAQHLAAEFTVRLRPHLNRKPIPAISLSSDASTLTACVNDYGFKKIFVRNLQALFSKNDTLIAISTSGNSENIIEALKFCKKEEIFTIGLLGSKGGKAKKYCNLKLIVPSNNTARIQETHIFLGHYIFENAEDLILKDM